ncbi:MAG: pyruvate kinase [Thermoflexales bacterium]
MRTRIVCTIGPASEPEAVLREMIRAGMDVARMNFSHGTHEDHARRIALVRRLAAEEGAHVAIMGDLQGPKFRVGNLPPEGIALVRNQIVRVRAGAGEAGLEVVIPFPHPEVIEACGIGQRLLIDDGAMVLDVVDTPEPGVIRCRVIYGGTLTSRKGVSAPGARVKVSSITPKDAVDVVFAIGQKLDALALSFVRRADDVVELRELAHAHGGDPLLVAKIEKPEALEDLDRIIRVSDVVMVARGDLGVEAAPEEVPFYQKRIIKACQSAGKPVITATQMLQSMIKASSPTRAEASDVANAVLDGTDAVMLSAESATGDYPIEAVRAMSRIAMNAEAHLIESRRLAGPTDLRPQRGPEVGVIDVVTDSVTCAAVELASDVDARAIVCTTSSGHTARMVARHRPAVDILTLTNSPRAYAYTAFMWGVNAAIMPLPKDADTLFLSAAQAACERGYANVGDRIVITAGLPVGAGAGRTNVLKIQTV